MIYCYDNIRLTMLTFSSVLFGRLCIGPTCRLGRGLSLFTEDTQHVNGINRLITNVCVSAVIK